MRGIRRTAHLALLAALAPAACGDAIGPPRPTDIRIEGMESALRVGETAALSSTVLDQDGRPLAGETVTWTSRDTTTATVDSAGVVTAVLGGEAWIVAESGAAADSVLADVRFDVSPGEARVRITGDTALVMIGAGASRFHDFIHRADGDHHDVLVGGAAAGGRVPMSLALFAPHRLEAGVGAIPSWPIDLLNQPADALSAVVAAVALVSRPVFGSVDEVIATRAPARVEVGYPGGGEIVVRLVAEADGYDVAVTGAGVAFTPNGRRYGVVADARLAHADVPLGSSDGVLEIGGVEQAWTRGAAAWGGLAAERSTLRVEAALERELRVELAWSPVDGATIGTWTLGREAGAGTAGASLRYGGGGAELLAGAVSGTLEVGRFTLGAEGRPGEILGRVDGTFVSVPGGADTLRAAFDFVAPVGGAGVGAAPSRRRPGPAATMASTIRSASLPTPWIMVEESPYWKWRPTK